jgi:hypothetical protein
MNANLERVLYVVRARTIPLYLASEGSYDS